MAGVFSFIFTPTSIMFNVPNGRSRIVTTSHANHDLLKEAIKELQKFNKEFPNEDAYEAVYGHNFEVVEPSYEEKLEAFYENLENLAAPINMIRNAAKLANGEVTVEDGVVYYGDEAIHNTIAERILQTLKEGFDIIPYTTFLKNLMDNPSKRAVDELYNFLEKNSMGITDDGHILAYKRVRDDYTDIHSGTYDNSPGKILSMLRNKVDDNKDRTCSYGFHFCSISYLPMFGSGPGNKVVIVKVNPRDVVSIPADYNDAKARCCLYEVLSEYTGSDLEDILASKSVWSTDEWRGDDVDADHFPDDEDDYLNDDEVGLQNADIVSMVVTRHEFTNEPVSVVVTWANGVTNTIDDETELSELREIVDEQAANGNKVRISNAK